MSSRAISMLSAGLNDRPVSIIMPPHFTLLIRAASTRKKSFSPTNRIEVMLCSSLYHFKVSFFGHKRKHLEHKKDEKRNYNKSWYGDVPNVL